VVVLDPRTWTLVTSAEMAPNMFSKDRSAATPITVGNDGTRGPRSPATRARVALTRGSCAGSARSTCRHGRTTTTPHDRLARSKRRALGPPRRRSSTTNTFHHDLCPARLGTASWTRRRARARTFAPDDFTVIVLQFRIVDIEYILRLAGGEINPYDAHAFEGK
jgi:hypothetical protein